MAHSCPVRIWFYGALGLGLSFEAEPMKRRDFVKGKPIEQLEIELTVEEQAQLQQEPIRATRPLIESNNLWQMESLRIAGKKGIMRC